MSETAKIVSLIVSAVPARDFICSSEETDAQINPKETVFHAVVPIVEATWIPVPIRLWAHTHIQGTSRVIVVLQKSQQKILQRCFLSFWRKSIRSREFMHIFTVETAAFAKHKKSNTPLQLLREYICSPGEHQHYYIIKSFSLHVLNTSRRKHHYFRIIHCRSMWSSLSPSLLIASSEYHWQGCAHFFFMNYKWFIQVAPNSFYPWLPYHLLSLNLLLKHSYSLILFDI